MNYRHIYFMYAGSFLLDYENFSDYEKEGIILQG